MNKKEANRIFDAFIENQRRTLKPSDDFVKKVMERIYAIDREMKKKIKKVLDFLRNSLYY